MLGVLVGAIVARQVGPQRQTHLLRLKGRSFPELMECLCMDWSRIILTNDYVVVAGVSYVTMRENCAGRAIFFYSLERATNFKGVCGPYVDFSPITKLSTVAHHSYYYTSKSHCNSKTENCMLFTTQTHECHASAMTTAVPRLSARRDENIYAP